MSSNGMKVREVITLGRELRAYFELRQSEFYSAQQAYKKAKAALLEFDAKYSRVVNIMTED